MAEIEERLKRVDEIAKDVVKSVLRHENALLVFILTGIVGVFGGMSRGLTLGRINMMNILLQSTMRGMAAIGQTFVILTAGIDISVGGTALMVSCMGASVMSAQMGFYNLPLPVGVLSMMVAGIAIGALNGRLISQLGLPPLIVTLAMWQVVTGASYQFTMGGITIGQLPPALALVGQGQVAGVPVPVIIFGISAVLAYFVLYYTPYGRSVYAVGGNPTSSLLAGINAKKIIFSVYIICGVCGALAGLIITSRIMSASYLLIRRLEIDSIAACCIGGISLSGGKGNLIGVIIGVLIIGVINNGMNIVGINPAFQDIVKGTIIIVAVIIDFWRRRG